MTLLLLESDERLIERFGDNYESIGFTGPRIGMTVAQAASVSSLIQKSNAVVAHHGDCIGGDAQFHKICRGMGLWIVGHPPINPKYRAWCDVDDLRTEKDYLIRDKDIILESKRMIAAPKTTQWIPHSGTWATITTARQLLRPLAIVYPAGTVEYALW